MRTARPATTAAYLFVLFLLLSVWFSACSTTRKPVESDPASVEAPVEAVEPPETPAAEPVEPPSGDETEGELIEIFEPVLEPSPEEPAPGEEVSEAPHDVLDQVEPELSAEHADEVRHQAEEPPTIDFPVEVNKKVLGWIDFYAYRNRDSFQRGLERSGRYLPMMRRVFREAGLPEDLVYFAHVESAYKTTAYSRARAKGIFQFIAATGKRYGLRVDYWVDERSDPEKSARASAAYLKDLYEEFGDWYLALAGYNAGEGKIRRALRYSGRDDFWGIAKTRYIRRETKNYVPAILAAILISKEPAKYGFDFVPEPEVIYETARVDGAVDLRVLAECAGVDVATLKALNPALRRNQTPPGATTDVRVPPGTGETMLVALAGVPEKERVLYARHRIRRGDTLSTIARRHGVSVYSIQQANNMGRRTMIRTGRTLLIPTSTASRSRGTVATAYAPAADSGETVRYRVRRGDSLWSIARRYGTTPAAIAANSGISVHAPLQIGQRLTVVSGQRRAERATPPASTGGTYRVRRGDTLWGIAVRHGTTPAAIARASGISTRSTLRVGQTLTLPGGAAESASVRVHTVRRGDTLWGIATMYRTSVETLCALNRISSRTTLYPGTKLTVSAD